MQYSTIFAAVSSVAAASSFNNVAPATHLLSYAASKSFALTYQDIAPSTSGKVMQAAFSVNSTRNTVVLEHFGDIACLGSQIILTMNVEASLAAAHASWSSTSDLAVFVGHETSCNGVAQAQSFQCHSMIADYKKNTLTIETSPLGHSEVFTDFEVTVGHVDGPESAIEVQRTSATSFLWDQNFNSSANGGAGLINNRNISMIKNSAGSVNCIDCYAQGAGRYELYIKSKFASIQEYSIKHIGEYSMNADFDVVMNVNTPDFEIKYDLASVPLAAQSIIIPGLLTFGPSLQLTAAVSFQETERVEMKFGLESSYAYDFEVSSTKGVFSVPKITSVSLPSNKVHQLVSSSSATQDIALHLIPNIAYSAKLFGFTALSLELGVDTAVGVQIHTGANVICAQDKTDYTAYEEASLFVSSTAAIFFKQRHNFLDTGKVSIDCPFCVSAAKCAAKAPVAPVPTYYSS